MSKNPYKVFSNYLEELCQDHIEGEVLEDKLLKLSRGGGYANQKDYEESIK